MKSAEKHRLKDRGFTIAEVLITLILMSLVMSGLVSSFMFMYRSTYSASLYVDMNNQTRRCMEIVARDVRQADRVLYVGDNSVVLRIPDDMSPRIVTYVYQRWRNRLVRTEGEWNLKLMDNVAAMALRCFDSNGIETSTPSDIKVIQFEAQMEDRAINLRHTNRAISARYILRNKKS